MPTAPMASTALKSPKSPEKFAVEKTVIGGVTLLTLEGTLHDAFEGARIAASIRTTKVIVNLRHVRRFASWGMSEWMDFLRINTKRDLYLVECSTYAAGQLNLVTGLLGHAKLVSFYASYRCSSCSEQLDSVFLIPRDRDTIRNLPGSEQECATCGGRARLDDYPAAYFQKIVSYPSFEIDDEVLALLRERFKYDLSPDLSAFRAGRSVHKGYTYLRLSGSMELLPSDVLAAASGGTTVVDLEHIVFNPPHVGPWQAYVEAALARGTSLQLMHCPPGLLEYVVVPDRYGDTLKIRSLALAYDCARCGTVTTRMVDVAENLEQLVRGNTPLMGCPSCQSVLAATLLPAETVCLSSLPARERDAALDKFLVRARSTPAQKLENCLVTVPRKAGQLSTGNRVLYVALALSVLVIAGLTAMALTLWSQRSEMPVISATPPPAAPPRPTFTRPDWILFDVPGSAYCHEMINRLMCIGISTYRLTRDDAVTEANDAALEELVSSVGLKISDPFFREATVPGYSAARARALSAMQTADVDRTSRAYAEAADAVRKARRRVVEALQASGGAAVPSQRSDWYWEEYAGENGKPNEILVFVRYDVSLDAVKGLIEKYSAPAASLALGTTAMTAFPAVAWQHVDFTGGAVLTRVGKPLAAAGIAAQDLVTAVGEQRVMDATNFMRQLNDAMQAPGEFALTVKTGDTSGKVVRVRH